MSDNYGATKGKIEREGGRGKGKEGGEEEREGGGEREGGTGEEEGKKKE